MHHFLVTIVLACAACGSSPTIVRTGAPLYPTLAPGGEARCGDGVELVPVKSFLSEVDSGYYTTATLDTEVPGVAVYHRDGRGPLELSEVLPQLGEPTLASLHAARLAPIHSKQAKFSGARKIVFLGAAVAIAGLGIMLNDATKEEPKLSELGAAMTGGGLLVEIVAAVVAWSTRPSRFERTYAAHREKLLIDGEDDLASAKAGVDRYNAARCR
jgi:hypothetical protein